MLSLKFSSYLNFICNLLVNYSYNSSRYYSLVSLMHLLVSYYYYFKLLLHVATTTQIHKAIKKPYSVNFINKNSIHKYETKALKTFAFMAIFNKYFK